ncbi:MAG: helix-turn-helix domain-containing protein [Syntrophothermus sp.]|uniref:helix-turn-helix domain-containing protein n=1 Tax=Syntrophothermus sp. TaxID=2736299 RepID=UPI00257E4721|nr:helix-turn-helix domain-containing protein [Syntrophothermus sp.]NSW83184.1 helix-turn-helix domain-containing protein [Syntrophothermus sp.]
MNEGLILTPEEAASYLRVDLRTVYKILREGQLPAGKVGRQWRIRKEDLDRFLTPHMPVAEEELSPEDLAAIQRGLEDIKAGRVERWEDLSKELGQ